jgi:hypothetical protein
MESLTIAYEADDGVGVITLDREEVYNAFNQQMQVELSAPHAVQASMRTWWAARQLSLHQMKDLANLILNLATSERALEEGQRQFTSGTRPRPKIR